MVEDKHLDEMKEMTCTKCGNEFMTEYEQKSICPDCA